jgi:hypothetical protein
MRGEACFAEGYGIVCGDPGYLIFRRMEPDQIRSTLTIEKHARELLDLLDSEDPQEAL